MKTNLEYLPLGNYSEQLKRRWTRDFSNILSEAVARLAGPSMIISTSQNSDFVILRNAPNREITGSDLERVAFISKHEVQPHCIALAKYAMDCEEDYERVILQNAFSFPACQIGVVVNAIDEVANYKGPLPFYARTILTASPLNN